MRFKNKLIAWFMCVGMIFSCMPQTIKAADMPANTIDIAYSNTATQTDATTQTDADYDNAKINYLYMESTNVVTPSSQKILIGIGDGENIIDSATLIYLDPQGVCKEAEATYLDMEAALFELSFQDDNVPGTYMLNSIVYVIEDVTYTVQLKDAGLETKFGVNTDVETVPDAVVVQDVEGLDGVIMPESSDGYDISSQGYATTEARVGSKADKVIIVLDPGHGNDGDPGATYTWNGVTYVERDLNLKIAQYCKAALEEYSDVVVYMTRNDNSGGLRLGAADGEEIGEIVQFAADKGADMLVSIHNNSGGSSAHGSEVYYPNTNYNPEASQQGEAVAEAVLSKLEELGLTNRGAKIRNSGDGTTYPDGSLADYYGIIRQSKLCGFPGIIIEHAFVSNKSDAENFLGSEDAIKRMGEADAAAIAEYFGLGQENDYEDGSASIMIAEGSTRGAYTLVASGVSDAYNIYFKVTSPDGKSSKDYGAIPGNADGNWYSNFAVSDFATSNPYGIYSIEAYVKTRNGRGYRVGSTSLEFGTNSADISAFDADGENTFILIAENLANTTDVVGVKFGVWKDGLSDLKWYWCQKDSIGRWLGFMSVLDYKKSGTYYTDAYVVYADGTEEKIGSTNFNVTTPTTDGIIVQNINSSQGTFDIVINGVKASSGVNKVKVPVWTAADLSDLYWYEAEKQEDGTYYVQADIKNHKYNYGVYAVQSYVVGNNGVEQLTYSYCFNLEIPKVHLEAFNSDNDSNFILVADDIPGASSVQGVKFGVWNEGLSDLKWYDAFKDEQGRWLAIVPISDYKKSGTYYADAYSSTISGTSIRLGNVSFQVGDIYTDGISVISEDIEAGTFEVVIKNVQTNSGVEKVTVPAWTAADLSDLHYYTASKQSNGDYTVTIDVRNHNNNDGVYAIQAYVTAKNGIDKLVTSMCYNFELSDYFLYSISGESNTSVEQMVAYYNANATYPSYYSASDAPTIETFCQIYVEECEAEGIKAEVAFCQSMKETGFLRFGGTVQIEQYNFAGIGATDSGGKPATFNSVREGVRAHVQHLKAYANAEPLNNTCVDPRFNLVTRGCSPYVEWLGIKENPYGKGWASATGYGNSIIQGYMQKLFTY